MAASEQYTLGTGSATLVASAPPEQNIGPVGWFNVVNTDATNAVYVGGGSGLSSSNYGGKIAASGQFSGFLFPGDQIYLLAAAGTPVAGVLVTGL